MLSSFGFLKVLTVMFNETKMREIETETTLTDQIGPHDIARPSVPPELRHRNEVTQVCGRPSSAVNSRPTASSFITVVATDRLGNVDHTYRRSDAMRSQCPHPIVRYDYGILSYKAIGRIE